MYSLEPTRDAQIHSSDYNCQLIGENDLGSVHLHGPFGKSDIKIAYLIGMHPLESKAHRALFETLTGSNNLRCEHYIYNIEVFNYDEDSEGRLDGQLLARDFVAPHIIRNKYDLFLDIHSNKGLMGQGTYEKTNFVFAPGFDSQSTKILDNLLENISQLTYYVPEFRTSPPYITVPVAESGIPTIVYETYSYEDMDLTRDLSLKLINWADSYKF